MKRNTCCIITRVSSSRQDNQRQINDLLKVAEARNLEVVEVIMETISGKTDGELRSDLKRVVELAKLGKIKHVLTSEISRLARKNSVSHKFLEDITELGVNLYWHSQQMDTLLENGKKSPVASMIFAFMADQARAETEVLAERIKSGLATARCKGKTLGRPVGTKKTNQEILSAHSDVVKRLKGGLSVRVTAAVTGKSPATVQKVRKLCF